MYEQKQMIRKKIKQKLSLYTQNSSASDDAENTACILLQSPLYRNAQIIYAYAAMPQELNIDKIIRQALADGKTVALPRILTESGIMEFFYLTENQSLDQQLVSGTFGIREPIPLQPAVTEQTVLDAAIILVPGLAFTSSGIRLGRGKGYYDRWLGNSFQKMTSPCRQIPVVGVCFDFQILPDIPSTCTDIPVSHILTPSRIIFCK